MDEKKPFTTFAIRVDKDEPEDIIDWLKSQRNKSESIKLLIRKAVNDYGIADIREMIFMQNEKIVRENKQIETPIKAPEPIEEVKPKVKEIKQEPIPEPKKVPEPKKSEDENADKIIDEFFIDL